MNNKKKVLVTAVAVILIAILSFSTLAWFSDTDEVENKFQIATSDENTADDIFSVEVFETDSQGNETNVGVTYPAITPNGVYDKNPTVRNNGAYDQYIRVKITFTDASNWNSILENGDTLRDLLVGIDNTLWTAAPAEDYAMNNKFTLVYYLNRVLEHEDNQDEAVVFTQVQIPSYLTQYDMDDFAGEFGIIVTAEAVQVDNLPESVTNAQQAFALVEQTQPFAK